MKKESIKQDRPTPKKSLSVGFWIYRFSVVFSAVVALMSSIADYGSKLLTMRQIGRGTAEEKADGKLLPYETPKFTVFGSKFVSDAYATITSDAARF